MAQTLKERLCFLKGFCCTAPLTVQNAYRRPKGAAGWSGGRGRPPLPAALERLADEGFPESVLRAIDALSKRDGESYDDFLARVEAEPLATRVKLLDLADNADLSRLASPTDADRARVEKYRRAIARLEAASKRRSLRIALDDASRAALRARAKRMHF